MTLRNGTVGDAVFRLQKLLTAAGYPVAADGWFGDRTAEAVRAYQRDHGLVVDGIAGPRTLASLKGVHDPKHLREVDIERVAEQLGVSVAAVHAIAEVETQGDGFLDNGRPRILFERHIMFRRLRLHGLDPQLYAIHSSGIVNEKPGGYRGGVAEYARLAAAEHIHRDAAIESASWGRFQVMGFHWQTLGYESAADFRTWMETSEAAHLEAFSRFIQADPELHAALRAHRWRDFARIYNGPAYAKNEYDVRLERAWLRHAEYLERVA